MSQNPQPSKYTYFLLNYSQRNVKINNIFRLVQLIYYFLCNTPPQAQVIDYTAVQRQKAVYAYFTSKHILPSVFAEQYSGISCATSYSGGNNVSANG